MSRSPKLSESDLEKISRIEKLYKEERSARIIEVDKNGNIEKTSSPKKVCVNKPTVLIRPPSFSS